MWRLYGPRPESIALPPLPPVLGPLDPDPAQAFGLAAWAFERDTVHGYAEARLRPATMNDQLSRDGVDQRFTRSEAPNQ